MATSRETRVQAYSPSDNRDEVLQLAELGVIEPKLYVHMIEVFSLPTDADKEQVLSHLTEGLSRTLAEYPVLTGTLHFDNETRRILAKKGPSSSVALHVKEAAGPGSDVESFPFLEKHDFPVHLLDAAKVLPPNVVGVFPVPGHDLSSEGPPVCAFQATFIQGGLILALAVTHQVCDGPGSESVFKSWSRNTSAVSKGIVRVEAAAPLLARAVRAATNQVTPEYVADLGRWALSCPDLRWTELDMHWVLGLDCMAFDWHTNRTYQEHDFGFGLPAALRWPHPQFEGFFFVLPPRTTRRGAGDDEGYEIMLGLEESCYTRLEKDEELLRYAEQRGTEV